MLDSEIIAKTQTEENQHLRERVRGLTILVYALVIFGLVFLGLTIAFSVVVARLGGG